MKIASWNINSVRLRINQVIKFVKDKKIDVLCLQETKTPDEYFPYNEFEAIGFKKQYYRGEKSYNGVAILSKFNFEEPKYINWCNFILLKLRYHFFHIFNQCPFSLKLIKEDTYINCNLFSF